MKPSYEELEEQLNRSRRLCDAALANERVWETAMMEACGEDGPKSVADKFAELEARCAALLASLETEPVAYMYKDNLHSDARFSLHTRFGNWSQEDINEYEITEIPLYAAPPAPVSVPDAATAIRACMEEFPESVHDIVEECAAIAESACRAAMLQGTDGNSPVIPDGWVACSERMPEENAEQEVLACFKGGDISTLYYFEGRWDDAYGIVPIRQDVTHWMPLPAAPKQEA
ncbi:DUF551 domain-containing protein [Enterobacter roggenkampii]